MIGSCSRCRFLVGSIRKTLRKQSLLSILSVASHNGHGLESPTSKTYSTGAGNTEIEPEEFGKLAEKKGVQVFKIPLELRLPKEDDEDEKPKPRFFSKFSPHWYFLQCKRLAKQNKTKECVEFFEEKMLKEDGVFPEEFNYTVVIGALGRAGQPKKAFQLYRQMRDRGIQPSMATYTGLFNSVAQCPDSQELRRATALYVKLHKTKSRINRITYNSLIKVYGRHGTTEQMMGIFRESIMSGFEPDSETFNMIMISLLKDKSAGFTKAIEVWRQMVMLDIKPDGKSISYLLKVLKNCGIGDPETAYRKLIQDLPDPAKYKDYFKRHIRNVYWLKGQQSMPRQGQPDQVPPEPEMITIESGVVEMDFSEKDVDFKDTDSRELTDEEIDMSATYKLVPDAVLDSTISLPPVQSQIPNLLQLVLSDNIVSAPIPISSHR